MDTLDQIDTNVADTTEAPADVAPVVQQPAEQPTDKPDIVDPADFYADDKPKGADDGGEFDDDAPQTNDELDPEAEPIVAPISWAKDAKEVFSKLPREAQEIIASREQVREQGVRMKMQEAAQTRQAVETEARTALQTIMQNHQRQLHAYASQIEATPPDLSLLASDDPNARTLYFQQEAQYRHASAQREQLAQQMSEAEQHAQAIAEHQHQAELQAEHSLLEEKLGTDWSDPSSRAKLLGDLTPIAAELGYPQELIAQARACDIIAMKNVLALKVKADKYDELQKRRMIPVRAARGNPIPPTSRPNAPTGQRQPLSVEEQMYPNDVRRN